MTKEFFESVMRIPSCSRHEDAMRDFVLDWAKKNGCGSKTDAKGNVYLTKGSAKFYPAFVNHMDTVHGDQEEMVEKSVFKKIIWTGDRVSAENPLTGKPTGLGSDNQAGCAIALAAISRLKAAKAIFTVEEEIGMLGIKAADKSFFDDAAFVFSNDSPDGNRATRYSSGTQLYSDEFFEKHLKKTCASRGVTRFNSEPWTCIKIARQWEWDGKHLECLNFGNGGDRPHSDEEGCSWKDLNNAEELLVELCEKIPTDERHLSEIKEEPRPTWSSGRYGTSAYGYAGSASAASFFGFRGANRRAEPGPRKTFTWKFKEESAARRFENYSEYTRKYSVATKRSGKDVEVSGPTEDVKKAWVAAFNRDNDKFYETPEDLFRSVKDARVAYAKSVKTAESPKENGSIFMPFDVPAEADEFEFELAGIPFLPVELHEDDDGMTASGGKTELKAVWVLYVNFRDKTGYSGWDEYERENGSGEFEEAFSPEPEDESPEDDAIDAEWTETGKKPSSDGNLPGWWNDVGR